MLFRPVMMMVMMNRYDDETDDDDSVRDADENDNEFYNYETAMSGNDFDDEEEYDDADDFDVDDHLVRARGARPDLVTSRHGSQDSLHSFLKNYVPPLRTSRDDNLGARPKETVHQSNGSTATSATQQQHVRTPRVAEVQKPRKSVQFEAPSPPKRPMMAPATAPVIATSTRRISDITNMRRDESEDAPRRPRYKVLKNIV